MSDCNEYMNEQFLNACRPLGRPSTSGIDSSFVYQIELNLIDYDTVQHLRV